MIKICTSEPTVPHADGGGDQVVRETAGLLLRILLLSPTERVPIDAAASVMGVKKTGMGVYVRQLREALGDDKLVVRRAGLVHYTGNRAATDAAVVASKHSEICKIIDGSEEIDFSMAAEIQPELEEIRRLYVGNPSMGLLERLDEVPEEHHEWAIDLETVVDDWVDLWSSVELMYADCRMQLEPGRKTGQELLKLLFKIARTPDPVEEVFPRLLKAAVMSGDVRQHRRAWDLTGEFYFREEMDLPEELGDLCPPMSRRVTPSWNVHRSSELPAPLGRADGDPIHEIAELLGITSALRLRGEEVEPAECIQRTTERLFFSGVLASKWVVDAGTRSEFDQLLSRLDDEEGDVRFLILDPDGDAYQRLYQMRGGRLSKESVPHLQRLARRHRSFQVRIVNALPAFRIVVIDEDFVTFSPYALEEERYATSRKGWDAPHIMLDPLAAYPLSDAFRLYFEERWSTAIDLPAGSEGRGS